MRKLVEANQSVNVLPGQFAKGSLVPAWFLSYCVVRLRKTEIWCCYLHMKLIAWCMIFTCGVALKMMYIKVWMLWKIPIQGSESSPFIFTLMYSFREMYWYLNENLMMAFLLPWLYTNSAIRYWYGHHLSNQRNKVRMCWRLKPYWRVNVMSIANIPEPQISH